MGRLKLRISIFTSIFMVAVAILYDALQIAIEFLTAGLAGWFINPFIDIWSFLTFFTWFKFNGVSFIRPSKVLTMGGSFVAEFIPFLNDLPTWTAGVIIMLAIVYAEDITAAISPQAAKALASHLSKSGTKNSGQDALDRLNSKRDLDSSDKERLVRARQVMESGHINTGEDDPAVLAAYEKYKQGIRTHQGTVYVDEKGKMDRGYEFSNVHAFGGENVVHRHSSKTLNSRAAYQQSKDELKKAA